MPSAPRLTEMERRWIEESRHSMSANRIAYIIGRSRNAVGTVIANAERRDFMQAVKEEAVMKRLEPILRMMRRARKRRRAA